MKSELLLPVGNLSMCLAAIHHGADAIYMGVPFFNARGRAQDLSLSELKEIIDLCHLYGVKVNLAFNVVIFQHEIPKVIELLKLILPLGPDAFIVQDLGLANIIRQMAPQQRIHASTQMTVTNPDAIKLVDDLGIDRFVLGRENSISDIKLIREQTDKELEVFVHGALCVAYSGQCFTSESLGGRSANRGQCAQSCRLEYELYVDDEKKEMGQKKYLVSPKDLMGIAEVPTLKELGVNSFKVEGRLKTPEYVAAAARNYREVLDGQPLRLNTRLQEMSTTYSRGFFSGWLHGVDHQQLVDGSYSSHRGLRVGSVHEIGKNNLLVESSVELRAGMGLLLVDSAEVGSKIFSVTKQGKLYQVELLQKNLKLSKGMQVYINSDEALERELQRQWTSREHQRKIPLMIQVEGRVGEPLIVSVSDPEGRNLRLYSDNKLSVAQQRGITPEMLADELGSLGTTVYTGNFNIQIQQGLFLNHKELKNLRRSLVEQMNGLRTQRSVQVEPFTMPRPRSTAPKAPAGLNILLRRREQVIGLVENLVQFSPYLNELHSIILDFEFGKDYGPSVNLLKQHGLKVGIATTRILKPSEYYNLKTIIRNNPDFILVRNLGALEFLKNNCHLPLTGDFSLNVTNAIACQYLLDKGLESINLSYDLNQQQLVELVAASDAGKVEITVHQYMPEFHMEHCVFAAFLSTGSSFRDCGKPCERHAVKLKDPYGNWHFLKADHECRNTFFKSTPQSASFMMEQLRSQGVGLFRLEALDESVEQLNEKVLSYLALLRGEISSRQLMERLQLLESYGLELGQLNKSDNYKDRKQNPTR
jgi:U32 family peptidase